MDKIIYFDYIRYKNRYLTLKYGGDTDLAAPVTEFVKEADKRSQIIYGENYSPEYRIEGVKDPRVALFFKLGRQLSQTDVGSMIDRVMKLYKLKQDDTITYS